MNRQKGSAPWLRCGPPTREPRGVHQGARMSFESVHIPQTRRFARSSIASDQVDVHFTYGVVQAGHRVDERRVINGVLLLKAGLA